MLGRRFSGRRRATCANWPNPRSVFAIMRFERIILYHFLELVDGLIQLTFVPLAFRQVPGQNRTGGAAHLVATALLLFIAREIGGSLQILLNFATNSRA